MPRHIRIIHLEIAPEGDRGRLAIRPEIRRLWAMLAAGLEDLAESSGRATQKRAPPAGARRLWSRIPGG